MMNPFDWCHGLAYILGILSPAIIVALHKLGVSIPVITAIAYLLSGMKINPVQKENQAINDENLQKKVDQLKANDKGDDKTNDKTNDKEEPIPRIQVDLPTVIEEKKK